jgi:hypothetical protein
MPCHMVRPNSRRCVMAGWKLLPNPIRRVISEVWADEDYAFVCELIRLDVARKAHKIYGQIADRYARALLCSR